MIVEYRIPMPLSVDEFKIAQLYMVAKASRENTGGGEGVEVLKNEPYDNTDGHMGTSEHSGVEVPKNKGQYTLKKYYLASRVPGFLAAIMPADSLVLIEEAWNAYPHCLTVMTNGYFDKKKFRIRIESQHLPDRGDTENALGASADALRERTVVPLDIASPVDESNYVEAEDPTKFRSAKTERGGLVAGEWAAAHEPVMTMYKLVTIDFKYWGLQTKTERMIADQQRALLHVTMRQAFCLIDEWHGLTMEDIRR